MSKYRICDKCTNPYTVSSRANSTCLKCCIKYNKCTICKKYLKPGDFIADKRSGRKQISTCSYCRDRLKKRTKENDVVQRKNIAPVYPGGKTYAEVKKGLFDPVPTERQIRLGIKDRPIERGDKDE